MRRYLEQVEQKINSLQVTQDEYEAWKSNRVTQRLMANLEKSFLELCLNDPWGQSVDCIGLAAERIVTRKRVLEQILEWKPQELEQDE